MGLALVLITFLTMGSYDLGYVNPDKVVGVVTTTVGKGVDVVSKVVSPVWVPVKNYLEAHPPIKIQEWDYCANATYSNPREGCK